MNTKFRNFKAFRVSRDRTKAEHREPGRQSQSVFGTTMPYWHFCVPLPVSPQWGWMIPHRSPS